MSDNWLYDRLIDFRNWAYQQPNIGVGDFTLHSGADFLLEAYQVTAVDLGDVQVLHDQRDALNQMLREGTGLHQNLQDGADALRGVWDSPTAAAYLPAPVTAFSIEHDTPQTTTGGMLLESTGGFLSAFQHNALVHGQWATDNQSLLNVQGEVVGILRDIVISIGVDAVIQWIPVVDLIGDAGEVAFLAYRFGRLGELINTFQNLSQAWRLLAILSVVSTVDPAHPLTVGLADAIHTLTLPQSTTVTTSGTTTTHATSIHDGQSTIGQTAPGGGYTLDPELSLSGPWERLAEQLANELGISAAWIKYVLGAMGAGTTLAQAERIIRCLNAKG